MPYIQLNQITNYEIKKHCDASACVRHLCGITPEQAADLVEAEQAVGDITEYTSKPPIFYESVDVKNRTGDGFVRIKVEMQGSDLIDKQKLGEPYIRSTDQSYISKHGLGLGTFIGKTLLEKNFAVINFKNSEENNGAEVIIKWKNKDLKNKI